MNRSLTVYAVDDGYFPVSRERRVCTIVVVIKTSIIQDTRKVIVFNDMKIKEIKIDSMEITSKIKQLIESYKPTTNDIILFDGITYAGFGVIDLKEIESIIKNIIVFFYRPLNLHKIKRALSANFPDWVKRYDIISNIYNKAITLEVNNLIIRVYSTLNVKNTKEVLRKMILFSPVPEPLRMAHIIASTLSRKALYIS